MAAIFGRPETVWESTGEPCPRCGIGEIQTRIKPSRPERLFGGRTVAPENERCSNPECSWPEPEQQEE